MPQDKIELARIDATRRFLGKKSVVGVGIGGHGRCVTFLLERDAATTSDAIRRWGAQMRVPVEIRVTGALRSA